MKISAWNFKGIEEVVDFQLDSLTVLTGANSGGKSTLIQLLLLIKQSLEATGTTAPLKLNKPYVSLGKFENLVRKGPNSPKDFAIELSLEHGDLSPQLRNLLRRGERNVKFVDGKRLAIRAPEVRIKVNFKRPGERVIVDRFCLTVLYDEVQKLEVIRTSSGKKYDVFASSKELFFDTNNSIKNNTSQKINTNTPVEFGVSMASIFFISFLPELIETDDDFFSIKIVTLLRTALNRIFSNISYIGPLRAEPKEFYFQEDDVVDSIGNKGENAAFILVNHGKEMGTYWRPNFDANGKMHLKEISSSFSDELNYWISDVFKLAKSISAVRSKTNRYIYTVHLKTNNDLVVPITHVGFGISQLLPILIEGLRNDKSKRRLIILEQPEIHLHPAAQSRLFDFVLSLLASQNTTSFLVETHSDHFINRLRRRVVESDENLSDIINLSFAESRDGMVAYRQLNISSLGSFDYWPDGFFDQYDEDMRALVKAQVTKKIAVTRG